MDKTRRNLALNYMNIKDDLERLIRMGKSPYTNAYEAIEQAANMMRQSQGALANIGIETATKCFNDIVKVNDLINHVNISEFICESLVRSHKAWSDTLKPIQENIGKIQASSLMSINGIETLMNTTEQLFAGINFMAMQEKFVLPEPAIMKLEIGVGEMTLAYENLISSIEIIPGLRKLPAGAIPGAAREIFLTGYTVKSISSPENRHYKRDAPEVKLISEADQETSCCIELLQEVDPDLTLPYKGAHASFKGSNDDRARHVLTSLRELWHHLLQRLAPDEDVLKWVPRNDKELLKEDGKPTRKARILYIFQNLNYDPLTDFIDKDTQALLKLMSLFNRLHELKLKLTDQQLRGLLLRTDSWITYILKIWKETK